jgi:hypothetical protein
MRWDNTARRPRREAVMIREFAEDGVRFRYPADWEYQREESADGWTATVSSPGTAFFLLGLRTDGSSPDEVAGAVLAALTEDYPELESEPRVESVAGQPAVGHDVQFFSLDLTNTCRTRCLEVPAGTLLVLCQFSDFDGPRHEETLGAMLASLTVED